MTRKHLIENAQFASDLSDLLRLGYPDIEAIGKLESIVAESLKPSLQSCVLSLQKGTSLAAAMETSGNAFSPILSRFVRCSEVSETLPQGLQNASDLLSELADRRNRCYLTLLYPTIVFTMFLALAYSFMLMIGRVFEPLFQQMNLSLPLPTKIALLLFEMINQPLGILFILLGLALVWNLAVGGSGLARLRFRVPILGTWLRRNEGVLYLSTLGHLTELGTPLVEAATMAKLSCSPVLQAELQSIEESLSSGSSLSQALKTTKFFDDSTLWLIQRREQCESLRLLTVTSFLRRELEVSEEQTMLSFEPIAIILIGGFLAFVILSLFLPMYQLIGNLG